MYNSAMNKEKSFPQNKHIVAIVRRKGIPAKDIGLGFGKSDEHGQEMNMFRKEPGSQKPICASCLMRQHRAYYVVEIDKKRWLNCLATLSHLKRIQMKK